MVSGSETDDEIESGVAGFEGMITCYNAHIDSREWIIDSGASDHMTRNVVCVTNPRPIKA